MHEIKDTLSRSQVMERSSCTIRRGWFNAVISFGFLVGPGIAAAQTVTTGPAQRVIVKWKQSSEVGSQSMANLRSQVMAEAEFRYGVALSKPRTIATGADIVSLDRRLADSELRELIGSLASRSDVEYVEEDRLMQPTFTPNDPLLNEQWHYLEPQGGVNLLGAFDLSTGTGVRVAVLDTGYRPHTDLVRNVAGGFDFVSDLFIANDLDGRDSDARDPGNWVPVNECGNREPKDSNWHGTHVAGTIAAVTNNSIGLAGVAFGAKVVPVRVLGRCGGYVSDIADAIVWASGGQVTGVPANANPARVINMSLGGTGACSRTEQTAIDAARSRGTVVVVAAGNAAQDAENTAPANCNGVITVAATDRSGTRAYYSNFGRVVDIAAPGGEIFPILGNGVLSTSNAGSTIPAEDSYEFKEGTSMAAPHVAAVAALMLARNRLLTPDEVEARLKRTARIFPGSCNLCGAGILNALAALSIDAEPLAMRNIIESLATSQDHTTFVAALKAAGVVEPLSSPGPFTVFAPTNAAFEKLPAGTVDNLLKPENKAQLGKVLTYHVVAGKLSVADLTKLIKKANASGTKAALKTVQGEDLTVSLVGSTVFVTDRNGNKSQVTIADVNQSNGVIHVIDTVLLPK